MDYIEIDNVKSLNVVVNDNNKFDNCKDDCSENNIANSTSMIRVKIVSGPSISYSNASLDTGSFISATNATFAQKLGLKMCPLDQNDIKKITVANSQSIELNTKVRMQLQIGPLTINHWIYCVKNLSHPLILGLDFMRNYGVQLLHDQNIVKIKGVQINFISSKQFLGMAIMKNAVKIYPNSEQIIPIRTNASKKNIPCETIPLSNPVSGLTIGTQILQQNGKYCAISRNNSDRTIRLKRNVPIGYVVRSRPVSSEPISDPHSTALKPLISNSVSSVVSDLSSHTVQSIYNKDIVNLDVDLQCNQSHISQIDRDNLTCASFNAGSDSHIPTASRLTSNESVLVQPEVIISVATPISTDQPQTDLSNQSSQQQQLLCNSVQQILCDAMRQEKQNVMQPQSASNETNDSTHFAAIGLPSSRDAASQTERLNLETKNIGFSQSPSATPPAAAALPPPPLQSERVNFFDSNDESSHRSSPAQTQGDLHLPVMKKRTCEELGLKLENCTLTENEMKKFRQLIYDYSDVFCVDNSELTGCTLGQLTLRPKEKDPKPFRAKVYPQNSADREILEKEIDELLRCGFIQRSTSNYSCPCFFSFKKGEP